METNKEASEKHSMNQWARHINNDRERLMWSIEDFKAGIEFAQQWISVEKELPNKENEFLNVPVIAITGFGNYRITEYNGFEWKSDEIITFWRPIQRN